MLANHGFLMREILVNDDKQIAVVITLPEEVIKKEADSLDIVKTVDFGIVDLMSLEPVDSKGRPLRLNQVIGDESLWNERYKGQMETEKSKELRRVISTLVTEKCNMKKVIRLAHAVWAEPKEDDTSIIYAHAEVDLSDWEKYRDYLLELSTHIKSLEALKEKVSIIHEAYYSSNRIVKRGNNSRRAIDRLDTDRFINKLVARAMRLCLERSELKCIWDMMKTPPMDYSYQYNCPNSKMRPRVKNFYDLVWADYMSYFPNDDDEDSGELDLNVLDDKSKKTTSPSPISTSQRHSCDELNYSLFTKTERLRAGYTLVD